MPKSAKNKMPDKAKIPDISWGENNHHLVWLLLGELEKPANYKVLFGKRNPHEVT
jgi:hypothetical protein